MTSEIDIKAKTSGDFVLSGLSVRAGHIYVGDPAPKTKGLDIGGARSALFAGKRVAREGWNGKRMHLELQVPDEHSKMTLPYVFMFTADGNRVPWLCSQTDFCATDWEIVS